MNPVTHLKSSRFQARDTLRNCEFVDHELRLQHGLRWRCRRGLWWRFVWCRQIVFCRGSGARSRKLRPERTCHVHVVLPATRRGSRRRGTIGPSLLQLGGEKQVLFRVVNPLGPRPKDCVATVRSILLVAVIHDVTLVSLVPLRSRPQTSARGMAPEDRPSQKGYIQGKTEI